MLEQIQERTLGTRKDAILNHPSHMISQKSSFDGYIIGTTQVSQTLFVQISVAAHSVRSNHCQSNYSNMISITSKRNNTAVNSIKTTSFIVRIYLETLENPLLASSRAQLFMKTVKCCNFGIKIIFSLENLNSIP